MRLKKGQTPAGVPFLWSHQREGVSPRARARKGDRHLPGCHSSGVISEKVSVPAPVGTKGTDTCRGAIPPDLSARRCQSPRPCAQRGQTPAGVPFLQIYQREGVSPRARARKGDRHLPGCHSSGVISEKVSVPAPVRAKGTDTRRGAIPPDLSARRCQSPDSMREPSRLLGRNGDLG